MPLAAESTQSSILWPLVGGLLIVLANAFFVTVEFAIVTVRRGQIETLAESGNSGARLILRLLRDPDWAIAGSQVGITLASILLGVVAEGPLTELLAPALSRSLARIPFLAGLATAAATLFVLLLLSFFHMVLGEQTPKTIALRYPVSAALFYLAPDDRFRAPGGAARLGGRLFHGLCFALTGCGWADRRSWHSHRRRAQASGA